MAIYGYARVSTSEQNTAVQLEAFKRAGVSRVVEEKRSAIKDRPELEQLLKRMKRGDVLVVYKLDRLARSVLHFAKLFEQFQQRGISGQPKADPLDRRVRATVCDFMFQCP